MAATKAKPETVPVDDVVTVRTKVQIMTNIHGAGFPADQEIHLPRAQAVEWYVKDLVALVGWAPSHEELMAAAPVALEWMEDRRRRQGGRSEDFWRIPSHHRWLERLDTLTRPEGPQGGEAA